MDKKILLGATLLGVSAVTLANGNGYVSTPMPKVTPTCDQFTPAFYVGIQGGYADLGWDHIKPMFELVGISFTRFDDEGFGARAYIGYDITKYLAAEAGYTYLPNGKAAGLVSYGVPQIY